MMLEKTSGILSLVKDNSVALEDEDDEEELQEAIENQRRLIETKYGVCNIKEHTPIYNKEE